MFHEYLVLRPAYYFCVAKGLPQAKAYGDSMVMMEREIKQYYANRNKTNQDVISPTEIYSI